MKSYSSFSALPLLNDASGACLILSLAKDSFELTILFLLNVLAKIAISSSVITLSLSISDRKSTRLNSSHASKSRMPSSA